MQDYRPTAPSYYETILLPHEGYGPWWADRSLTDDATITFPSIFWGGERQAVVDRRAWLRTGWYSLLRKSLTCLPLARLV